MTRHNFLLLFKIAFIVIIQSLISCNKQSGLSVLQDDIERIATRWVPDHREGISQLIISEGKNKTLIIRGETDCKELKQEVIDSLTFKGYSVTDSVSVLPGDALGELRYGLVSLSVINLRKEPAHSCELVSQSLLGTPLKVLKNDDNWLLVQTPDRYIAWTEKASVQLMNESDITKWKDSPRVIYMDNSGWIYESTDEQEVIGDLVAGCLMINSGHSAGYTKVILPDKREGYVRDNSVKDFDSWESVTLSDGGKIYKVASTIMGLPYLWGGSSTKAVDCSGFVQTVYFMNGIILSRDASLQALHGLPVSISEGYQDLKPGDLLFFGSVRNSRHRITHVAIYKGDSEFIHAAGRVMVNSLDSTRNNFSSYRKNTLLSARRIIGSVGSPGIVAVKDHDWY